MYIAHRVIIGTIGVMTLFGANIASANTENKQKQYRELQDRATIYKENLKAKRQEKTTLANQLEVLDQKISLTEIEIEQAEIEIDDIVSRQDALEASIQTTEEDINTTEQRLANTFGELYNYNSKSFLEITLANASLSDFSTQVQYTENVANSFNEDLHTLIALKQQQAKDKQALSSAIELEEIKKANLAQQKNELTTEADAKNILIEAVGNDEEKFQALVTQIQQEQIAIDAEISRANNRSLPGGNVSEFTNGSGQQLSNEFKPDWPIASRRVTATFADPTYPYLSAFVHKAIDIGTPHGTPIRAADSGIVNIVHFDGTTNYAYINLRHADNFSTTYGHVSQVYVQPEQVVQKGEIIGATGATPGTIGAGIYTTGPHLHFEVSLNGIKVDPLMYLP